MDWTTITVAILGSSALTTLITYILRARLTHAEATKISAETEMILDQRYIALIEKMEKRVEELEKENKELQAELQMLHRESSHLQAKIDRIAQILIYSAPDEVRRTEVYRSLIEIIKK